MGYFVDIRNGKMIAGNSAAGALAAAALASAAKWFQKKIGWKMHVKLGNGCTKHLHVKEYLREDLQKSCSVQIAKVLLQYLESFVMLYQYTKERIKWLKLRKNAAHQCSSWVVCNIIINSHEILEFFRLG